MDDSFRATPARPPGDCIFTPYSLRLGTPALQLPLYATFVTRSTYPGFCFRLLPKFAGLAAFIPVKLPLSTILSWSFPFSRSFCSSHSLINHSYLTTTKGNQHVCSTHELTRYFHTHVDIMPPKQATLGYVKPKQQTLGCMLPALRL